MQGSLRYEIYEIIARCDFDFLLSTPVFPFLSLALKLGFPTVTNLRIPKNLINIGKALHACTSYYKTIVINNKLLESINFLITWTTIAFKLWFGAFPPLIASYVFPSSARNKSLLNISQVFDPHWLKFSVTLHNLHLDNHTLLMISANSISNPSLDWSVPRSEWTCHLELI